MHCTCLPLRAYTETVKCAVTPHCGKHLFNGKVYVQPVNTHPDSFPFNDSVSVSLLIWTVCACKFDVPFSHLSSSTFNPFIHLHLPPPGLPPSNITSTNQPIRTSPPHPIHQPIKKKKSPITQPNPTPARFLPTLHRSQTTNNQPTPLSVRPDPVRPDPKAPSPPTSKHPYNRLRRRYR
ncbi:hypothetical protein CC80DRAFT_162733 [Byssothecium circinans]|uniref:Uncharacterized protein n=1 Tax=Byssothecium circinans TaxID=147558 RepID=A0A6A5UFM5_9PLEO|nr:hypothetical protein CC80DRAFT_162733 [Byssothecium circinans]